MRRFLKGIVIGGLVCSMLLGQSGVAFAGWESEGGSWFWKKDDGTRAVNGWQLDADGSLYYLGNDGKMATGWLQIGGQWYYLNNVPTEAGGNPLGKPFGAALSGWQWIDGKCYYFQPQPGLDFGKMFADTVTPDSYKVNKDGQWVDANGTIQTASSKGITSAGVYLEKKSSTAAAAAKKTSGGSPSKGGGGGGGGSSSGGGGGSSSGGGGSSTNSQTKAMEKVIQSFKEKYIKEGMSDFEKEMMIIRYMVENIEYDYDSFKSNSIPSSSYKAYGALVKGKAVCNGYALAFQELASACGLHTKFISGTANGVGGWGGHAWNKVCLDGKWYNVDVTWEDPVPTNSYGFDSLRNRYINLTDKQLREDHKWSGGEVCNSEDYTGTVVEYYMYTGKVDTQMRGDKWRRHLLYENPPYVNYMYSLDNYGYKFDDNSNYFTGSGEQSKVWDYITSVLDAGYRSSYLVASEDKGLDWLTIEKLRSKFGGDKFAWNIYQRSSDKDKKEYVYWLNYNEEDGHNPLLTEEESRHLFAERVEEGNANIAADSNESQEYMKDQAALKKDTVTILYKGLEELCTAPNYANLNQESLSSVKKTSEQTIVVDGNPYHICSYQLTYKTLADKLGNYLEKDQSNLFDTDGEAVLTYLKRKVDTGAGKAYVIYTDDSCGDHSEELTDYANSIGKEMKANKLNSKTSIAFEGKTYTVYKYELEYTPTEEELLQKLKVKGGFMESDLSNYVMLTEEAKAVGYLKSQCGIEQDEFYLYVKYEDPQNASLVDSFVQGAVKKANDELQEYKCNWISDIVREEYKGGTIYRYIFQRVPKEKRSVLKSVNTIGNIATSSNAKKATDSDAE